MMDLATALCNSGYDASEAERLAQLIQFLIELPDPSGPLAAFPRWSRLRDAIGEAMEAGDADGVEESFLELYAHLHMNEASYSPDERQRMDDVGGYWNHAGGLSPILKAARWIEQGTVSADFGSGNGLQGLLLQHLYPHAVTVQIEIAGRMAEIGEGLREWLGIPAERVRWEVKDVMDVSAAGFDFIYLYRPVRPVGRGRDFYTRFAHEVQSEAQPPVIFSIADCLRQFLDERYSIFYSDGHLTCFKPS
jgi:hypothetical protein